MKLQYDSCGVRYAGDRIYLRTLDRGEALSHFDLLSADVEGENPLTAESISLGLAL